MSLLEGGDQRYIAYKQYFRLGKIQGHIIIIIRVILYTHHGQLSQINASNNGGRSTGRFKRTDGFLAVTHMTCVMTNGNITTHPLAFSSPASWPIPFSFAVEKLDTPPRTVKWAKTSDKRPSIFASFASVFGWKKNTKASRIAKRASMPVAITDSQKEHVAAVVAGRPAVCHIQRRESILVYKHCA